MQAVMEQHDALVRAVVGGPRRSRRQVHRRRDARGLRRRRERARGRGRGPGRDGSTSMARRSPASGANRCAFGRGGTAGGGLLRIGGQPGRRVSCPSVTAVRFSAARPPPSSYELRSTSSTSVSIGSVISTRRHTCSKCSTRGSRCDFLARAVARCVRLEPAGRVGRVRWPCVRSSRRRQGPGRVSHRHGDWRRWRGKDTAGVAGRVGDVAPVRRRCMALRPVGRSFGRRGGDIAASVGYVPAQGTPVADGLPRFLERKSLLLIRGQLRAPGPAGREVGHRSPRLS